MKLDPCTVTFAGVTLTESPHGISGFNGTAQGIPFIGTGVGRSSISTAYRGNDAMSVSFQVARFFSSPEAAGVFARTHAATLRAATGNRGNLDFAYDSETDRMAEAVVTSVSASGPFDHNRVVITYAFTGQPITTLP